jgi:chromosome segregation ATPase
MENGGQIKSWGAHGGGAASVEFLRDGRLVSCGRDRVTKLWDQNGGQQRAFAAFGELALEVTYCDETNRCIAGDWTGDIRVWDAADGKQLGELSSNPPKLAERLAESQTQLVARQKEQKPPAAAYQGAQAAVEKTRADLVAANKTKVEQDKQRTAAQTLAKTSQDTVAKLKAEYEPLVKLADRLSKGVPVLKEAVAKSQQAAKQLADDKELADAVSKLVAISAARETQLKDTQKQVAEKEAELKKATTALAEAQKRVEVLTKQIAETVKKIETLTAAVKPLEEKATAAKKVLDAADGALQTAVASVEKWQTEIAFADKIMKLMKQRTDALSQLENRLTESQDAQQAAKEAQAKAEAATTSVTAAQLEIDKVNAEIQAARELTEE